MTKKFLIIFIFLIALQGQFCLAKVFSQENSIVVDPNNVPDALAQYQVAGEAKGILDKITGEWQKINNWGSGFYLKNIEPRFGKYVDRVVNNVRQGWEEEKQEYRQDFFKALGTLWEKIKNKLFHR